MNISYAWIKSLLPGLAKTPREISDILAMQGAPVDEIVDIAGPLRDIRVARVIEAGRHPNADRLSLCRVDDGNGNVLQVVCGAPNVKSGGVYPFAPVGTQMPDGLVIKKSKIRGEESQGMLCSARELGLGKDHDGIMELDPSTPIGGPLIDVLMLDDARIVVDVTPNRPDLLSHLGVAREIGAAVGLTAQLPVLADVAIGQREQQSAAGDVSISIDDQDLCPRYLALIIRGVKVGPSPAWLSGPLRAIGLRPISNVVDATNYVLHELGQPLHAFDVEKVGNRIIVRRAKQGERIRTLDDVDRALSPDMLVIADAARPIAVAGVMGGADTEVDDSTTDILLECALFKPSSVRATRRILGLSTDASYRFERGVDPATMEIALKRAADLIIRSAGGAIDGHAANAGAESPQPAEITLRLARVKQVLGIPFDTAAVRALLTPLGFDVLDSGDVNGTADVMYVRVPGHRSYDVTREEDLIEEIARRHGYDAFPDELRPSRPSSVPDDPAAQLEDRLRTHLVGNGMLESRTLAFAPDTDGDVALMLPLASTEAKLRGSIVPTLLRRTELNYTRGQRHVRLFEIGTAFKSNGPGALPGEQRRAAGVVTGAREQPHWTGEPPAFDMWDLKGIATGVAEQLGMRLVPLSGGTEPGVPSWADTSAAWAIVHAESGNHAGYAARVLAKAIDSPAWADPTFAFEVGLPDTQSAPRALAFRPLPAYPPVERDLALLVAHDLDADSVLSTIRQSAGPLLETAFPFDVYRGKGIAAGLRSVALRLRFRANDRTLTDEEVDRAIGRVLARLKEDHGIERRG